MSVWKTQEEDPVEAAIAIMKIPNIGIRLNFQIKITGNFEETGDEAEVSAFNSSLP